MQRKGGKRIWGQLTWKVGEGNGKLLQCSCLENPRDGEPGGLPSMGSHSVGHDLSDLAAAVAAGLGSSKTWNPHPGQNKAWVEVEGCTDRGDKVLVKSLAFV